VRDEKITEISFVGTVGGLLGLFMGFSFVSCVEIFYLCFAAGSGQKDSRVSAEVIRVASDAKAKETVSTLAKTSTKRKASF